MVKGGPGRAAAIFHAPFLFNSSFAKRTFLEWLNINRGGRLARYSTRLGASVLLNSIWRSAEQIYPLDSPPPLCVVCAVNASPLLCLCRNFSLADPARLFVHHPPPTVISRPDTRILILSLSSSDCFNIRPRRRYVSINFFAGFPTAACSRGKWGTSGCSTVDRRYTEKDMGKLHHRLDRDGVRIRSDTCLFQKRPTVRVSASCDVS